MDPEPEFGDDVAGAEPRVVGLDQGDHHPAFVRRDEERGVASLQGGVSGLHRPRGAGHVDTSCLLRGVPLIEQRGDRRREERRVRVVPGPVRERELLGFHQHVPEVRVVPANGLKVVALEDVEQLERRETLAVGRQLPHRGASVGCRDRLLPLAGVPGEVLHGEEAADLLRERHDLLGDLAAVVGIPAPGRQQLEGAGECRVGERLAFRGSPASRQEDIGEPGFVLEARDAAGPRAGDDLRHRCALPGVHDGGRQEFLHGQPAEPLVQLEPGVGAPGNGPGVGGVDRHRPVFLRGHLVGGQRERRPAGAVEAVEFTRRGVPHHGEQVPAEAARHGLHEAECRVDGDRRVHRAPAFLEHLEPDLNGERLCGRHHPVTRHGDGTGREQATLGAVGSERHGASQRANDRECGSESHGHIPQR